MTNDHEHAAPQESRAGEGPLTNRPPDVGGQAPAGAAPNAAAGEPDVSWLDVNAGVRVVALSEWQKLRAERDRLRAVLEGMEFQKVDELVKRPVDFCRMVGIQAKLETLAIKDRADQAERERDEAEDAATSFNDLLTGTVQAWITNGAVACGNPRESGIAIAKAITGLKVKHAATITRARERK